MGDAQSCNSGMIERNNKTLRQPRRHTHSSRLNVHANSTLAADTKRCPRDWLLDCERPPTGMRSPRRISREPPPSHFNSPSNRPPSLPYCLSTGSGPGPMRCVARNLTPAMTTPRGSTPPPWHSSDQPHGTLRWR